MKKLSCLFVVLLLIGCSNEDSVQQPSCSNPEIAVSDINLNGATINFNNFVSGSTLELEYGESDFIQGNGTTVSVAEMSFALIGLDSFKSYDVYVRNICSGSESEWVGPLTFVTQCDVDNGIFQGNVTLTTQQQVDEFGAMCYSGINGILRIGNSLNNDINSLLPLTNINSINSSTGTSNFIVFGTQLQSFEGINILNSQISLYIDSNNLMTNLGGIRLNNSIESLFILNNSSLIDLNGLEELVTITRFFGVKNNDSLLSLQGLNNLESWFFNSFEGNDELRNFEGLDSLETVVDLWLIDTNIVNFIGLESLTSISSIPAGGISSIEIYDNELLESFEGLENVTVTGTITFQIGKEFGSSGNSRPNPSLSNYCGLQNLLNNSSGNVELSIANNLYNPTAQDIINGNCSQ